MPKHIYIPNYWIAPPLPDMGGSPSVGCRWLRGGEGHHDVEARVVDGALQVADLPRHTPKKVMDLLQTLAGRITQGKLFAPTMHGKGDA